MPQIQVIPLLKGIGASAGSETSAYQKFTVTGTTEPNQAMNAVLATLPIAVPAMNGFLLPLNQVQCDEIGPGMFQVNCTWGTEQNKNQQDPVFTFDNGGATQKITNSISTSGMYAPAGQNAPNFNGAIGVTKDGIDGVSIPVGEHNWQEKHYLPDAIVTPNFRIAMTLLKGRTNAAPFRGFDVDQVRFDGITGSKTGKQMWEINFHFAAGPHLTEFTIGNISGINKKAWEYLWVFYRNDISAGYTVNVPVAIYVEQVLWQGDFTILPIPQGPTI